MTQPLSRLVCLVCIIGSGLLLPGLAHPAEVEQTDAELERVNEAITEIEAWIDEAGDRGSQLEQDLRAATRQISALEQEIAANETEMAKQEALLKGLLAESERLQQKKTEQEELVGRALRASYMLGQDSTLKLLLNLEDPGPGSRMLRYYAAFNESRMHHIAGFQQVLDSLESTARQAQSATAEREQRSRELQTQLASLSAVRQQHATILAALQAELASRSGELEQLLQDRQHLENLLDEINRIVVDIPAPENLMPFADSKGTLRWPLEGPLLSRFGASYSDGNLQRQGVIITAPEGSPVRAIHPGRVVFADWLRGSGFLVVIDHGQGYMSLYAHNQAVLKRAGDWANRGEIIGTAGDDAGMGSPGLYFEIRHDGQAQNPADWCVPQ